VSFTTGSVTTGGPSRGGVTVSRAADPPDLPGPPTLQFVAPGSVTAGRYGLFEYAMGPYPAPRAVSRALRASERRYGRTRRAMWRVIADGPGPRGRMRPGPVPGRRPAEEER